MFNNLRRDFNQHRALCWLAVCGLAFGLYSIFFSTNNVIRSLHHENTYSMEQYNASSDHLLTYHIQQNRHQEQVNDYQNQERQQQSIRQQHLERSAQIANKLYRKHGVTRITYHPKNRQLNVRFDTKHPSQYQQHYAQQIVNQVNK